jgi:hypothetical protein
VGDGVSAKAEGQICGTLSLSFGDGSSFEYALFILAPTVRPDRRTPTIALEAEGQICGASFLSFGDGSFALAGRHGRRLRIVALEA